MPFDVVDQNRNNLLQRDLRSYSPLYPNLDKVKKNASLFRHVRR